MHTTTTAKSHTHHPHMISIPEKNWRWVLLTFYPSLKILCSYSCYPWWNGRPRPSFCSKAKKSICIKYTVDGQKVWTKYKVRHDDDRLIKCQDDEMAWIASYYIMRIRYDVVILCFTTIAIINRGIKNIIFHHHRRLHFIDEIWISVSITFCCSSIVIYIT